MAIHSVDGLFLEWDANDLQNSAAKKWRDDIAERVVKLLKDS